MRLATLSSIGGICLALAVALPASGETPSSRPNPIPGTINYVEGQVSVGGVPLAANSAGTADLAAGQTLTTTDGRAEILLTPGVFLRAGHDSAVQMISPDLLDTEVGVTRGEATLEVTDIHRDNNIRVVEDGVPTQVVKDGLYDFDARDAQVRVFKGKAVVYEGDRAIKLKKGRELNLFTTGEARPQKFDRNAYISTDLYRWTDLRSAYVAEANVSAARVIVEGGWYGPGWWGDGWYWSPWFDCYTFVPWDGIYWSPFGWGFYSPPFVYEAPVFYRGSYYHHFSADVRDWGPGRHYLLGERGHAAHHFFAWGGGGRAWGEAHGFRGGRPAFSGHGTFHGGASGFRGGGGFHGGGFGGGFHGGAGRG